MQILKPIEPGGSEYALDGKAPGFESDEDMFFFANWNLSVLKKIVGHLFVCLSLTLAHSKRA